MIPRETDSSNNTSDNNNNAKNFKAASSSSTTTSWSRFKDPRIVRVSRSLGGKDRHSKVCTVRGLRDRRVRLSVPTAIQLYDLQERLGLNQPSKVVDWLLNAAKHEIDELPPLQIPQGSLFSDQPMLNSHEFRNLDSQSSKHGLRTGTASTFQGKTKDHHHEISDSFHLLENHQGLLNSTNSIQYNSFVRFDPPNLTLSHPPRGHGFEDWHNSTLSSTVQTGSHHHHHQFVVYQPGMSTTQSYFPSQNSDDRVNYS
ncbi:hypothetical protein DH2020_009260 [Rehmannia glutinosa]|uniref:TCP domain-containing protein n=1 Tax=Rehmannia glutinosa TaxID=99300 RepID=A0ABR0X5R4_REHGL